MGVSDCCLMPTQQFLRCIMARTSFFQSDYDELPLYTRPTLKQQSVDRHVDPLGHIILIPSQPVFPLSPYICVLSRVWQQIPMLQSKV